MAPLDPTLFSSLNGGSSHSSSGGRKSSDLESSSTSTQDRDMHAAQEGCRGALSALLHFLSQQGVSEKTIAELQQSVGSSEDDRRILLQIQKYYLACLPAAQNDSAHCLLLGCWNTQYRLAQMQYQAAHQQYHVLRFGHTSSTPHVRRSTMSSSIAADIEKALQQQIYLAEQVCACQKEILLCRRRYEFAQRNALSA